MRPSPPSVLALTGLARVLFGRAWRRGVIAVVGAYFDESESQNPRDVYVLGACASSVERWLAFNDAWSAVLREATLTEFHATEWATWRPEYRHLSDQQHAKLGEDLFAIIAGDTVERCVVEALPHGIYQAEILTRMGASAFAAYNDPYIFDLYSCMTQLVDLQERAMLSPGRINCFFVGRKPKDDRTMERQYDRLRADFFPGRFGPATIGVRTDPELQPCQAADFLAYETMRRARERLHLVAADSNRPRLETLADLRKFSGGDFIKPERVRESVATVLAHLRGATE